MGALWPPPPTGPGGSVVRQRSLRPPARQGARRDSGRAKRGDGDNAFAADCSDHPEAERVLAGQEQGGSPDQHDEGRVAEARRGVSDEEVVADGDHDDSRDDGRWR